MSAQWITEALINFTYFQKPTSAVIPARALCP